MPDPTPPPAPLSPEELDRLTAAVEAIRPVIDRWDHYGTEDYDTSKPDAPERTIVNSMPALIASARRVASLEAVERAAREFTEFVSNAHGFCPSCQVNLDPAVADPHDENCRWPALADALDAARTGDAVTTCEHFSTVKPEGSDSTFATRCRVETEMRDAEGSWARAKHGGRPTERRYLDGSGPYRG